MSENSRNIDTIDRKILQILQADARTSNAEIARRVDMTPSAIGERIRKLEESGIVRGCHARVAPEAVGARMLAFVFVRTDDRLGDGASGAALAEIPEVQEVHHISGEDCFLAKVRTSDPAALGELLREKFGRIPTIVSTRTTIVMGTLKETMDVPVDHPGD